MKSFIEYLLEQAPRLTDWQYAGAIVAQLPIPLEDRLNLMAAWQMALGYEPRAEISIAAARIIPGRGLRISDGGEDGAGEKKIPIIG